MPRLLLRRGRHLLRPPHRRLSQKAIHIKKEQAGEKKNKCGGCQQRTNKLPRPGFSAESLAGANLVQFLPVCTISSKGRTCVCNRLGVVANDSEDSRSCAHRVFTYLAHGKLHIHQEISEIFVLTVKSINPRPDEAENRNFLNGFCVSGVAVLMWDSLSVCLALPPQYRSVSFSLSTDG